MKFKIGDIITNGKVTFRIEDFGKNFLGYYYKLVNVDSEKKGLRYLKQSDGSYFGETGWLCEQVDELFHLVQDKTASYQSKHNNQFTQHYGKGLHTDKRLEKRCTF